LYYSIHRASISLSLFNLSCLISDSPKAFIMNGTAMQLDSSGDNNRKPAARRRRSSSDGDGARRPSNTNGSIDFSKTVERILSTLEQRGEDHDPEHGPLTRTELSKLSLLCTHQQQQRFGGGNEATRADSILNNDLGFADVDVEMIGQLVEYLEKHVALASVVNIVQACYQAIQSLRSGSGEVTSIQKVSVKRNCKRALLVSVY
jgi:hypothetical protein